MDSHPLELYRSELETEGELYRRLSQTSRKMKDIFGETEDLYIKRGYLKRLDALLEDERNSGSASKTDGKLLEKIVHEREYVRQNLPQISLASLPETLVAALRKNRVSLIRAAIRDGSVVPSRVVAQYPQGFFAEDFAALPRYMKACHTVFTNRHGRVDESLFSEFGCKVRRQDGRAVGDGEIAGVRAGLEEIFRAVGDFSGLMRTTGLTIIHTGGRRIFRYPHYTCGVYQSFDQTITLGVNSTGGKPNLASLAHELVGHWLDTISTPPQPWIDAIFGKEHLYLRDALHTSFIDAALRGENALYPQLIFHMILPPDECPPHQYPSHNSSELWARLAEQYTARSLGDTVKSNPVSVCTGDSYYRSVGYWERSYWQEGLMEIAREQVRARVWMAERVYGICKTPDSELPQFFLQQFPWAEKFGHQLP